MIPLSMLLGTLVGFSLGLSGGGGAIFAVPLLVYGLGVTPRDAIGVSLVTVGATALVGCLQRARAGQVELRTGLIFALAGMLGAPIGSMLAGRMSETMLLLLFALLMLVIAVRMWRIPGEPVVVAGGLKAVDEPGPACHRDPAGVLRLNSRCAMLLSSVGLATGVLSGLFGVGGGFIIVPALVTFSGMGMQRAIGTSLLVIAMIGSSGVISHFLAGREVALDLVAAFGLGSILGLFAGTATGRLLSGRRLQRVFSVAIVLVAVFVIFRDLTSHVS